MAETVEKKKAKEKREKKGAAGPPAPPPRLWTHYRERAVPGLRERFGYQNDLAVPRLAKVVVSAGVGRAVENKKRLEDAVRDLGRITGQKPMVTKARRSISGFRLRQGMAIGAFATLRRLRMYEFLDRLVSVVIPRIRDFRGLPRRGDGRGNYNLGIAEQTVFPEIKIDDVEFVQGVNVALVTTAKTDEEGLALLEALGVPFRKA